MLTPGSVCRKLHCLLQQTDAASWQVAVQPPLLGLQTHPHQESQDEIYPGTGGGGGGIGGVEWR